jgi:hypothetical protein
MQSLSSVRDQEHPINSTIFLFFVQEFLPPRHQATTPHKGEIFCVCLCLRVLVVTLLALALPKKDASAGWAAIHPKSQTVKSTFFVVVRVFVFFVPLVSSQ